MKTLVFPFALLVFAACDQGHAADQAYRKQVVRMNCGEAAYTLTSMCAKSEDPFELNACKPQSLQIEHAGTKRSSTLPELPRSEVKRIQASGGKLKDLFVVKWACSSAVNGPIATLHYSVGGGNAEYSETWSHYDKAGKLVDSNAKLTPAEVKEVERNFKKVPSIMPD